MKIIPRPKSLYGVSIASIDQNTFGVHLADFEHELASIHNRKGLGLAIEREPKLLNNQFRTGNIADAWLAAYAELLAFEFILEYPSWLWAAPRFLNEPYFQDAHSPRAKLFHILKSPPAFTRRNLFVDIVLPAIELKRGRPKVSAAHKREMNRKRVAKFRSRSL